MDSAADQLTLRGGMRTADREDVVPVIDQQAFDVEQGKRAVGEDNDLLAALVDHRANMAEEIA